MFCSKCGNKSPAEARFCHKCGSKMMNNDNAPQVTDYKTGQPAIPSPHETMPRHIDDIDYFTPQFASNHSQNMEHVKPAIYPARPPAEPLPAPAAAEPAPTHPDFMDYAFFPASQDAQSLAESTQLIAGNMDSYDYPLQLQKTTEPEPPVIAGQSFVNYPVPQAPPKPAEPEPPLATNADLANFPAFLDIHIPPAAPATEAPGSAGEPIKQDIPKPAEPVPPPIEYIDYQPPTTPNHTEEAPLQEVPIYDDYPTIPSQDPNNMAKHMPKKKKGAAIIAGITGITIIAVMVAIFIFSRGGNVNPEQLIGTWVPAMPHIGTRVHRLEFRDDGTGLSYQFDEFHNSRMDEVVFSWSIESGNMLRNTLWAEMASIEVATRSGQTIFRYRLESLDYWYEYRQLIYS